MFEKIKQLKQIQSLLSQSEVEEELEGVKIKINGKMEILEIQLNPELEKEKQEKVIQKCFNQALKKMQGDLASKMSKIKEGL
ncbi:YbaB/EbfC family nucleoid-associated protein [Patescibacteria group bacterium]|nr:YbaB/EbfC family nucleoid-associated protein [Patescibacteria group bacterium]